MCGKDVVAVAVAAVVILLTGPMGAQDETTAVVVVVPTALAAFVALAHNGNRVLREYVEAGMREVLERGDAGVVDKVLPSGD
jgi:hypothetical protein